jgi:hypothetical protein
LFPFVPGVSERFGNDLSEVHAALALRRGDSFPWLRVDKIPVLGTGKTDYKVLRALIAAEGKQPVG